MEYHIQDQRDNRSLVKKYSILKIPQRSDAFGLAGSPGTAEPDFFRHCLFGHSILYMPLKNPPKIYQKSLMFRRYYNLKSPPIYTSILAQDKRIKIFQDIHFHRIIIYHHTRTHYHKGHFRRTFVLGQPSFGPFSADKKLS